MKRQFIIMHIFFLIISLAYVYYNLTGPDLIWNMVLAILAFDFAFVAYKVKRYWISVIAMLAWLFFYPNTFYMLTDVVHMSFASDILKSKISFVYYIIYMSSMLLAVIAGILSVKLTFYVLKIKHWLLKYIFIVALSFISSLAIHIGRFARLNSWNILTHPNLVIAEILKVFSYSEVHFVLGFTFIQIMCLWLLDNE